MKWTTSLYVKAKPRIANSVSPDFTTTKRDKEILKNLFVADVGNPNGRNSETLGPALHRIGRRKPTQEW